jgi:DNA-binding XRE family transcriptional regulator
LYFDYTAILKFSDSVLTLCESSAILEGQFYYPCSFSLFLLFEGIDITQMSDFKLPIGKMIKTARIAQSIEQADLSRLTGIARTHLSIIENGKVLPSVEMTTAIEAALGIRFSDPTVQAAFSVLLGHSNGDLPNAQ